MRKLFWCGWAAVMVCAVGVYWAAQWAERHPQAPMAGCARIPWRLLTDWNPVVQVGQTMGAKAVALFQGEKPPPAPMHVSAPACAADPGPDCPPPIVDVIDLSTTEILEQANQNSRDYYSGDETLERELARVLQDSVETVLPGDIEEAEQPAPKEMPPADDDVPAKTINPDEVTELLKDRGGDWYADDTEELPMPRADDAEAEDIGVMPAEDTSETPKADEDEYQVQLEPPGPQRLTTVESPERLLREMAATLSSPIIINEDEENFQTGVDSFGLYGGNQVETLPMPHEEVLAPLQVEGSIGLVGELPTSIRDHNEGTEESEAMPGKPADCKEVPNMEERCPECPAGCPKR